MIRKERLEEIEEYYCNEADEPESQEWRNTLNEEEHKLIAQWDERISHGITLLLNMIQNEPSKGVH